MPNTVMVGEIAQVNRQNGGVKLVGDDTWYDWSRYAEGDKPNLTKGMRVRLEVDSKNFLRGVTAADGSALGAVESNTHESAAGGGRWQPEDSWRATLLSALRTAGQVIPYLIVDGKVGEGPNAKQPSEATYALGLYLARRAWLEPMPPRPGDNPPEAR